MKEYCLNKLGLNHTIYIESTETKRKKITNGQYGSNSVDPKAVEAGFSIIKSFSLHAIVSIAYLV